MSLVKGIGHAAMRAADAEKTAKFYKEILGFEEAFRMYQDDGTVGTIYLYLAPGQFIEVFSNGTKTCTPDDGYRIGHCHMCYVVEDVEKTAEELKSRGITLDREITRGKSKCLQLWIHDPDGNKIELMQIMPESMQAEADRRLSGR